MPGEAGGLELDQRDLAGVASENGLDHIGPAVEHRQRCLRSGKHTCAATQLVVSVPVLLGERGGHAYHGVRVGRDALVRHGAVFHVCPDRADADRRAIVHLRPTRAAAANLIHERGVAGTSLEDIRDAARVSNSQLYHYFADKDHLVRGVIAHQGEQVVGTQERMLSQLDSFAGLRAWRDCLVDFSRLRNGQGGCPIGSLASELAEVDDRARLALADCFARWERAIRDGLAAMRERGELRDDADPDRLALATLAALQGGLLLAQTRRDTEPVEAALDAAIGCIRTFAS